MTDWYPENCHSERHYSEIEIWHFSACVLDRPTPAPTSSSKSPKLFTLVLLSWHHLAWKRVVFVTGRSRVRIPWAELEILRNSCEKRILHTIAPDRLSLAIHAQAKIRSSSVLQQQLTHSLASLAPGQGTRSVSCCKAEGNGNERFGEPDGRRCWVDTAKMVFHKIFFPVSS